jgi:hypothetical protein
MRVFKFFCDETYIIQNGHFRVAKRRPIILLTFYLQWVSIPLKFLFWRKLRMDRAIKRITILIVISCFFSAQFSLAKPVNREKALKAANTFLQAEKTSEKNKLTKVVAKEVQKQTALKRFDTAEIKEIKSKDGKVLAYVTELKPEGFVITSADDTIKPILGYSFKGKFPFEDSKQNVLLHLVQWDVQARNKVMKSKSNEITALAQTNNDLWNKYSIAENGLLGTLSDTTQWGPLILIATNWDQGDMAAISHYNRYCPTDPFKELPSPPFPPDEPWRCPVGCVATALGQIVNCWEYPSSLHFDESDSYSYKVRLGKLWTTIHVDEDHTDRDFPTFETLNSNLSNIGYTNEEDEEAYLCFGLGVKLQMSYEFEGSGTYTRKAGNVFLNELGYGSAQTFYNENNAWTGSVKVRVIENIKKGWPIQIGIKEHSVILDGYRNTDEFFHLNMGWSGITEDTWYDLPIIDTSPYGINYYSGLIHTVVCDIAPYQGWSQWGADEKNSFSTIYVAPTTNPPINKWYRTCSSGYSFKGLAVGTGNRIYASSVSGTQGNHPSIWVINQYGEKEKEITINEEIDGLTYPVQNSSGEVFVGADSGKVYRINPKDNSYNLIFTADAQLYKPPKVDSDGRIYVCTLYKLYCLSRTGYKYWEFPTPNTNYSFFRKVPAIDVERNRLYIDYYNASTDIAYLVCINRTSGTEICQKSFTGITSGFNSVSTPSIGPDGTVYAGCNTYLYAFNPDATLSQKWAKNLSSTYVITSPTIGPTDAIYTSHWVDLGGGNYNLRIGARDASNGNLKWEYSQGTSNICDSIGDIYVSGNNVVSFWYNSDDCSSPSTHTIYALRDNGASYDYLWEKDFGQQGGQTAFGPGATLYTISSTLAGNTIYALSEGAVGDPDGGGMGFTDNATPAMPFNPSPIDEANNIGSTVTLSWSCTDPENHSLKYSLFVGESGYDMVPVATEFTSTSYQLTGLKPGTGYAWKIIATDGQAISEGPTWVFATKPPNPDLNGDGMVNFFDFAILASQWLGTCSEPDYCEGADYYRNGQVDSSDLSYLCENWLEGVEVPVPPEPNGMVWVSINEPNFTGEMSKYETTNAQYCQFLNAAIASGDIIVDGNDAIGASGSNSGEDFVGQVYYYLAGTGDTYNGATNGGAARINYTGSSFTVDSGFENHPVTYVSWYGATAFCNYYGYRLPTEWEWQAVADYDGNYTYGCGTTINNSIANYEGSIHPNGTTVVGAFGTYGYGMCDMAGNVHEWTSSCFYSDCWDGSRVNRGGSWDWYDYVCEVSFRYNDYPDLIAGYLGFRVCR